MNASMNIIVLKSKLGMVSGVVIPIDDLHEVQEFIKRDSELHKNIAELVSSPSATPESEIMLPHGKTIAGTQHDVLRENAIDYYHWMETWLEFIQPDLAEMRRKAPPSKPKEYRNYSSYTSRLLFQLTFWKNCCRGTI